MPYTYRRNGTSGSGDLRWTRPKLDGERAAIAHDADGTELRQPAPRHLYADAGSDLQDVDAIEMGPDGPTLHRDVEAAGGGAVESGGGAMLTSKSDVVEAIAKLPNYGKATAQDLWESDRALAIRIANA